MEKLMIPQKAEEFVYHKNHRLNPKTNHIGTKMNKKFAMLEDSDYDDGVSDNGVT
jgi:hypothetical protein